MPILIKGNKIINNGGAGISMTSDVDVVAEDNLIQGNKGPGIEIRDLNSKVENAFSQIDNSNLTEADKTKVKSSIINLIKNFPQVSLKLLTNTAVTIEILANSPIAYRTVLDLIEFIKVHAAIIK